MTNRIGGEPIRAGFDITTNEQVPFETVREMVADDIKRTYALTTGELSAYNGDPLEWALRDATAYERSVSARNSRPAGTCSNCNWHCSWSSSRQVSIPFRAVAGATQKPVWSGNAWLDKSVDYARVGSASPSGR